MGQKGIFERVFTRNGIRMIKCPGAVIKANGPVKRLSEPHEISLALFHKHPEGRGDGRQSYCKPCIKKYKKEWRKRSV